jgi:3-dehydroquinate synthase
MQTVHVPLGSRGYDVIIGKGILAQCGQYLTQRQKALVVTDSNVLSLGYAQQIAAQLAGKLFSFSAGEQSKTLATAEQILNASAEFEITGGDILVAVGGGVVGDLTGFAAALYRRGVSFIQVPTTLLAAVDSSVGGKTGVNLAAGKNLAGAFWQPSLVLCDIATHATLPAQERANGAAECLKYGVLWDEALFASLETGQPVSEAQIARCVALKRDVVACDERDTGQRRMLNLGHTLGHAIEQVSGYGIPHGAAVGIGMVMIAQAFCPAIVDRLCAALAANGLPAQCPYSLQKLFAALSQDKKRVGGEITVVVPLKIGQCELQTMPLEELKRRLERL